MPRSLKALAAFLSVGLLAACTVSTGDESTDESASDYPSQRITIYVGFPAGGNSDIVSRATADFLSEELGETVVVENLPGANGAKAMQTMLQEDADGYHLAVITNSTATAPLKDDVGYTREDYVPVGGLSTIPAVIAVPEGSPYTTAEELLGHAKENPGDLKVGVVGVDTAADVELSRMQQIYDVEMTSIPLDGEAGVVSGLLGKNIDAAWLHLSPPVLKSIEAGDIVPLIATSKEQLDFIDPIPTLAELGYPELVYTDVSYALAAPADTDPAIAKKIEDALSKLGQDEAAVQKIGGERYIPTPFVTGEEFGTTLTNFEKAYQAYLDAK